MKRYDLVFCLGAATLSLSCDVLSRHAICVKSGPVRGLQSNRAAAVGEMHEAKVQADKAVRRKKAINILAEARKDAQQQVGIRPCELMVHHISAIYCALGVL